MEKHDVFEDFVKVGMMGDTCVGKEALVEKMLMKPEVISANGLGASIYKRVIPLTNLNLTISLWMYYDPHDFETLFPMVCSDAKVMLFVFDLTQKDSLFSIKRWYKEARKENKTFIPFLIGTRYERFRALKGHQKQVMTENARNFARKMLAPLIYCSSDEGINVENLIKLIIAKDSNIQPNNEEFHDATKQALFEIEYATDREPKSLRPQWIQSELAKYVGWAHPAESKQSEPIQDCLDVDYSAFSSDVDTYLSLRIPIAEDEEEYYKLDAKDYELCRLCVERCGSRQWIGKYVFCGMTRAGHPAFEHVNDKHLRIEKNHSGHWEFVERRLDINGMNSKVWYYSYGLPYGTIDEAYPPLLTWKRTELANLPAPVVRIRYQETTDNDEYAKQLVSEYMLRSDVDGEVVCKMDNLKAQLNKEHAVHIETLRHELSQKQSEIDRLRLMNERLAAEKRDTIKNMNDKIEEMREQIRRMSKLRKE